MLESPSLSKKCTISSGFIFKRCSVESADKYFMTLESLLCRNKLVLRMPVSLQCVLFWRSQKNSKALTSSIFFPQMRKVYAVNRLQITSLSLRCLNWLSLQQPGESSFTTGNSPVEEWEAFTAQWNWSHYLEWHLWSSAWFPNRWAR